LTKRKRSGKTTLDSLRDRVRSLRVLNKSARSVIRLIMESVGSKENLSVITATDLDM
jgi:hypothetical protein